MFSNLSAYSNVPLPIRLRNNSVSHSKAEENKFVKKKYRITNNVEVSLPGISSARPGGGKTYSQVRNFI